MPASQRPDIMPASDDQSARAAIAYHEADPPGKVAIQATKPVANQADLALAYSPGVAHACLAIAEDPAMVSRLTARGNLVGVISNGTAVLGLGNIGPMASKPVMEGKGVLFKKFANIDCYDIEVDETEVQAFVEAVARLEPTFGGINLEDIKAPECFEIERQLKARMNIPVFHDDQHGTAIVVAAGILNGLKVVGKDISQVKLACSGAGAAALACLNLLVALGLKRENVIVSDIEGVVHKGRTALMDPYKDPFARETDKRTLADAMAGADVFLGLSAGGIPSLTSPIGAPSPRVASNSYLRSMQVSLHAWPSSTPETVSLATSTPAASSIGAYQTTVPSCSSILSPLKAPVSIRDFGFLFDCQGPTKR